jgi:succinate dehydrogenase / fumarate reductase flavoprotein subunit
MWEHVGMARSEAGLKLAIKEIAALRSRFWEDVKVIGGTDTLNRNLETAGRVADFMEIGELMARDALQRSESCGGHFRVESQTPEGEAKRDDEKFAYVAAWEYKGANQEPVMHKEPLVFENVKPSQRSYK